MKRNLVIGLIALVSLGLVYFIWTVKRSVNEKFAVMDTVLNNLDTARTSETKTTNTVNADLEENIQPCSYENNISDLGIGIVIAPETFEIFDDSLLTKSYATINMYEDEDKINFCSKFYKPDYGIMHFVCLAETPKGYKVLTGFSEQKYLPKKKGYEFRTWSEYISQSFGIRRKYDLSPKQQLKEQPLESSKDLEIPGGLELLCPMELKGDWIKVKYDCFYDTNDNPHEGEPCHAYIDSCDKPLTGWIKWRHQNELWIDIFLMP